MHGFSVTLMLLLIIGVEAVVPAAGLRAEAGQAQSSSKQLHAVRGEITKIRKPAKGMLSITVRPAKEFAEVTVLARENDFVGNAVGGTGDVDLFGLLSGDAGDEETITAAELQEGDTVSVIYDPQAENRVVEIYVH